MHDPERFVENAPLLPKLAEAELGEAQERLPASRRILDRAPRAGSGRRCDRPGRAPPSLR
jgi:hypothetical protein